MSDDDLFTLNNMARPLGYFCGRHKTYDAALGGGEYFLMPRKKHRDERVETLIKYQTFEQVEEFLQKAAAEFAA